KARKRGYRREQFSEAFKRYLSENGGSQPSSRPECDGQGTSDISQPSSPKNGWTVAKCEKPNNDGLLDTCAAAKGGSGGKTYVWPTGKSDDLPYPGPIVDVPDQGPAPLDEHGAPRPTKAPPLPLTPGRARDLRAWSLDWATAQRDANLDFTTAQLEAELRIILRKELPPSEVEAAIKQVVDLVFRS